MNYYISINVKSKEAKSLIDYLKNIRYVKFLSNEEREDIALTRAIDEGRKTKSVPEEDIYKILNKE